MKVWIMGGRWQQGAHFNTRSFDIEDPGCIIPVRGDQKEGGETYVYSYCDYTTLITSFE